MNTNLQEPARYVFTRCALSMLLLWLSFPPMGLSWLAWVALIPLVSLVVDRSQVTRSQYWAIWLCGLFYWMGTFYFIPIPHPALWAGWIAISLYLAFYLPIFVLSSRTLAWKLRLPAILAIPIAWTGWELVRCYLLTGMPLVCLSHTQYLHPQIIQICDLFGAYTLTFAIALIATGLFQGIVNGNRFPNLSLPNLLIAVAAATGIYLYGQEHLGRDNRLAEQPLSVALIQGSIDTVFPETKEEYEQFEREKTQQYIQLTNQATTKWQNLDVVVWPENGWPIRDLHPDTDKTRMQPIAVQYYEEAVFSLWPSLFVRGRTMPQFLVGALSVDPVDELAYASALHYSGEAEVVGRYYKNYLVMFGEYVPLSDWIPLLQRVPAIGKGIEAGTESISLDINGRKVAPSICFESTVPHYIRNQVNTLAQQGEEPDILINMTNDGWFYGTSCLDFHLACNVFRAVEMRKPHLVCANTGFSAVINEKGEIEQQGPRRATDFLKAEVVRVDTSSPYRLIGDWIPFAFAGIAIFGWLFGLFGGRFGRSTSKQHQTDNIVSEGTNQ